jgi:hypothetical protein
MAPGAGGRSPSRVVILADDLIWATRLDRIVRTAGADPTTTASADAFMAALAVSDAAIVDLAARRADPIAAIAAAVAAGNPVVAVGPHEDREIRKRALAAGAGRVFAYSKLHDDGPRTVARWLDRSATEVGRR